MRTLYARTRFLRRKRLRGNALRARILTRLQNQFSQEQNPKIRHDLHITCLTIALAWTGNQISPKALPNPEATALSERILTRLWESICRERDPWVRDDLRIAWMTVKWAAEGIPEWSLFSNQPPHVAAWRQVLHCDPEHVWYLINEVRRAKLGKEYSRFYDEDGMKTPGWGTSWEIPDYDPTSELRIPPQKSGLMYQMPTPNWPAEQDSLRDPQESKSDGQPPIPRPRSAVLAWPNAKQWPKAPLRRIVSVRKVWDAGRVVYHREELECGHSHVEFLGANPGKQKRRCAECAYSRAS